MLDPQPCRRHPSIVTTSSSSERIPTVAISPLSSLRSVQRQDSTDTQPSLTSVKSVDSVPYTGIYPLGTLRINDPKDDDRMDQTVLKNLPDRTRETPAAKYSELRASGDVLILDDLPADFTIGSDTISFSTKQQFLGFKQIPSGAHFVWVSPSQSASSRSGFWFVTPESTDSGAGRVHVFQWDNFNEVLSFPASQAEERIQKESLDQIFDKLSPYQFQGTALSQEMRPAQSDASTHSLSQANLWYQLTFAIRPQLLSRIIGGIKEAWPVHTADAVSGEKRLPEETRIYGTSSTNFSFTFPMDQRLFNKQVHGSELTQQALDPTYWILSEIDSQTKSRQPSDLVGELQFAFLTGMHLGNYSCLEQWWHYATHIIFKAYRLALERPQLTRDLLQTIHTQLLYEDQYLDGNLMDTMPSSAKQLKRALTTYKSRLNEMLLGLGDRCTDEQKAVGLAFEALESWLWRFGWDLRGDYVRSGPVMLEDGEMVEAELSDFEDEDERGEYAAVVVDLDEQGRPTDLVTF